MIKTLKDIIEEAKKYLTEDFVLEDIYWIIEETLNLQKYQILARKNDLFEDSLVMERVKKAVDVPVAYILGKTKFYTYDFKVSNDTLIPRNETEELVEMILKKIEKSNDIFNILDIGTGTGCIAITLDKELTKRGIKHKIYALDISGKALEIAKENSDKLNANVEFYLSDVYESFEIRNIDLIVSNPPYIDKNTFVMDRVKNNEPHIALFAEENGLIIYRRIIKDLNKYAVKHCYFEISPDLVSGLTSICKEYLNEHDLEFIPDMNGFIRFMRLSIK